MPYPNYTTQELAAINAYLQNEAALARDQRNLLQEINAELKGQINNIKEATKQYNTLEDIAKKLQDDAEEMNKLTDRQLEKERDKAKAALRELNTSAERLVKEKGIVNLSKENLSLRADLTEKELSLLKAAQQNFLIEQDTLALIDKRIDYTKNLNKSVGLTGSLLKSASKITDKLGLHGIDHIFEDANEAATGMAKQLGVSDQKALGLSGKVKVMGAGAKELGKGLFKALSDPLAILGLTLGLYKKIFEIAQEHDEVLTKTGRTLGINKELAGELYEASFKYANASKDAFLNADKLQEAQAKLNDALGSAVDLGDKNAEASERLSHYYGLSEEAASKLVEFGVENKKNGLDILNTAAKTYTLQRAQNGGAMSFRKTLTQVSGISSDIYIRFKGNVEEMTKAVMQADRLGLSLEQTAQIGESLLNFESSIESELKSELLTGKAINLEKARQYALSGDLSKLNQEIVTQVGGIHEFEKMNVIQRKAYAEAFGMNVEQMSTMLRKQEFEAQLTEEAKKSAEATLEYADKHGIKIDEALRAQYEQKSVMEETKEVMTNLSKVLGHLVEGPMKTFFHYLEKGVEFLNDIVKKFGSLTGGKLGSALGAAIIGVPAALLAITTLKPLISLFGGGGGMKSLFFQRGTPGNPMVVTQMGGGIAGELGEGMGKSQFAGGGFNAGKKLLRQRQMMSGMKIGGGLAIGGMALSGVAGMMDEGTGKDIVSGLGATVSGAGTGAMIGSMILPGVGTAIGAAAGALWSLYGSYQESEAKREAKEAEDKAKREAADAKTKEMVEALTSRPIHLNVGGKTILEYNNASTMYGTDSNILAK
jgi:hypothetical protein